MFMIVFFIQGFEFSNCTVVYSVNVNSVKEARAHRYNNEYRPEHVKREEGKPHEGNFATSRLLVY